MDDQTPGQLELPAAVDESTIHGCFAVTNILRSVTVIANMADAASLWQTFYPLVCFIIMPP